MGTDDLSEFAHPLVFIVLVMNANVDHGSFCEIGSVFTASAPFLRYGKELLFSAVSLIIVDEENA